MMSTGSVDIGQSDYFESAKQLLQQEDFNFLVERLIKEKKWSRHEAQEACQLYKNYLFLKLKYGDQYKLPPSLEIDEVWHTHILFTNHYADFCNRFFGTFLHHLPSETNDFHTYRQLFDEFTQEFHKEEFGSYIHAVNLNFKILLNTWVKFIVDKLINFSNKLKFILKFLFAKV